MKPRIFFERGMWRCLFARESTFTMNSWEGAGDTPREAWDSMLKLMGADSWLVSQGERLWRVKERVPL